MQTLPTTCVAAMDATGETGELVFGRRAPQRTVEPATMTTPAQEMAQAGLGVPGQRVASDVTADREQHRLQLADLILVKDFRVASPLECIQGFGDDIEHRFEISNGSKRFGVVIILTALARATKEQP